MPSFRSVKNLQLRISRLARAELRHQWQNMPIKSNTILYESYSGNGMLCQPEALFRRILNDESFSNFTHIWAINDFDRYSSTIEEYKNYHNVRFVKYLSNQYYRALSTSQYLINNVSFPAQFVKRQGQIYLNTWHGIPLKRM